MSYPHTVKVSVILACRSRTEQQATQGTIHHLNVPPSLHRSQIQSDSGPRHSCSDLSGADSPAERRLTPTERDISWWQKRGGAHSLPASCSVSKGTLAELRQQSVRHRAAGDPERRRGERRGSSHFRSGLVWPDDSSLPGNGEIDIRQGNFSRTNNSRQQETKQKITDLPNTLSETHFCIKCLLQHRPNIHPFPPQHSTSYVYKYIFMYI